MSERTHKKSNWSSTPQNQDSALKLRRFSTKDDKDEEIQQSPDINLSKFSLSTNSPFPNSNIQRQEIEGEKEEGEETPGAQLKSDKATAEEPEEEIQTKSEEPKQEEDELVQTKLTVGQPGDKYEQEADTVAAKVVEQINSPKSQQPVQGKVEPVVQPTLMRQGGAAGEAVNQDVEQNIQQARGNGQGLADNVRQPMEQAFGADFSGVKVHTDGQADVLNRSLNSRAFATGQDIFFKQGEYQPGSKQGQELLAHELTHVVQQGVARQNIETNSTSSIQRQPTPICSNVTDADSTCQSQAVDVDTLVTQQLDHFLERFSNILVKVYWIEHTETQCVQRSEEVMVRPPYFINKNDKNNRRSTALDNRKEAKGEARQLIRDIKTKQDRDGMGLRRALIGKSNPEDIQKILQEAINRRQVKPGKGRNRPNSDDLRIWLVKYGIGIDCSGFVSQALNQVMQGFSMESLTHDKYLNPMNIGSASLQGGKGRFNQVANPKQLRPGDTMHFPGHIRIITVVYPTEEGYLEFQTAESSSRDDDIGPIRTTWRYENPSKFSNLKRKKGKNWEVDKNQNVTFGRYSTLSEATQIEMSLQ